MSQVKNLRAMFESKGSSEPSSTDRGRSPLLSPRLLGDSSRPISKVRTNFVAVEKDGRVGLQLEGSISTSAASPNSTPTVDPIAPIVVPTTQIAPVVSTPKVTTPIEPVPTPAPVIEAKPPSPEPPAPKVEIEEKVSAEPTPVQVEEKASIEPTVEPTPAPKPIEEPKQQTPRSKPVVIHQSEPITTLPRTKPVEVSPAPESAPKLKAKELTKPVTSTRERTSRSQHRPAASVSQPARTPSRPAPKRSKTPGPSSTRTRKEQDEATKTLLRKKSVPADLAKAQTQATRSRSRVGTSANRSQSRPADAQARTRSRAPVARTPLSRKTSPVQTRSAAPVDKKQDSASKNPASRFSKGSCSDLRGAATTAPKLYERAASRAGSVAPTLRRQPSVGSSLKKAHASLGPPPKKKESPAARPAKDVDEGFLARMMRPTQSSQSKVTEKIPTTPPRKNTTPRRPPTRAGSAGRRDPSVPASVQRRARPASRPVSIISPAQPNFSGQDFRSSGKRSVSKSSTGTQTDESLDVHGTPLTEVSRATGQGVGMKLAAGGDIEIPRTPEALPSLDNSLITSADMLDGSQQGEPTERLLQHATEALGNVSIESELQKKSSVGVEDDVFGASGDGVEIRSPESY